MSALLTFQESIRNNCQFLRNIMSEPDLVCATFANLTGISGSL